jgi:hypothetical protein
MKRRNRSPHEGMSCRKTAHVIIGWFCTVFFHSCSSSNNDDTLIGCLFAGWTRQPEAKSQQTKPRTLTNSNKQQIWNRLNHITLFIFKQTVAYLLKARAVEPEKQPLLGIGAVDVTWLVQETSTQKQESGLKRCFVCGPCIGYIRRTTFHYGTVKQPSQY